MGKYKTVGIIGGLGPNTTADMYLRIISKFNSLRKRHYPSILIYSVPLPFYIEKEIVKNSGEAVDLLPYLKSSVEILEKSSDFIALPCNTAHIFLSDLRRFSKVPILDIIEETAKKVDSSSFNSVGILATKKTLECELYQNALRNKGIESLTPTEKEREVLTRVIYAFLAGELSSEDV